MLHINRVAKEVHATGLYDLVLQDVKAKANKEQLTQEEVKATLLKHPELITDYEQINVEYNISNIHIKPLHLPECQEQDKIKRFNENLALLQSIEKYTLDFEHSSILVIIMSVEFFVLFSAQYFIVLLNLKSWQIPIYAFFALSIVWAWLFARKKRKEFKEKSAIFYERYKENLAILDYLEAHCNFKRADHYIEESDEHI